jgi:hypothetical protein
VIRETNQARFAFEPAGRALIAGVWTEAIGFVEHSSPTLVCDREGRDRPISGTVWVDPSNGQVVRTQVTMGQTSADVRMSITVSYRLDSRLGIWVPSEMRESYRAPTGERIECRATYGEFRRYEVEVQMDVKVPKTENGAG